MAEIMDDVVHLSEKIGPHPAGTEEEQQAALYLAGKMQKESGFVSVLEDFRCVTNYLVSTMVCFGLGLICVVLSIILPILVVPAFIIVALVAVMYVLEMMHKPVISRFLRMGASQNIVSKYQPTPISGVTRRRKIILVANYDSGRALKDEELSFANVLPLIHNVATCALVFAALLLFLRMTIFATDTGAASSIITLMLAVCAVLFAITLIRGILHLCAPYSQSANNNAAGVSVLLDVARRVGNGLVSNEEILARKEQEEHQIHGESAARDAGVVPEGASVEYDNAVGSKESLAAAKAAIEALTGEPVADKIPVTDISSRLVKGGGLDSADDEIASSVRFEVGGSSPYRKDVEDRFQAISLEGVSQSDTSSAAAQGVVDAQDADAQEPPAYSESEVFDSTVTVRSVTPERSGVATAAASAVEAAGAAVQQGFEVQGEARETFEKPAPFLHETPVASSNSTTDKTPSWAKAAQAKARANKPEESQPKNVSRSRYADTVAARMTNPDSDYHREEVPGLHEHSGVSQQEEHASENSELASRLAELHSQIESTEAPQISESTQAVIDSMDARPSVASKVVQSDDFEPVRTESVQGEGVNDAGSPHEHIAVSATSTDQPSSAGQAARSAIATDVSGEVDPSSTVQMPHVDIEPEFLVTHETEQETSQTTDEEPEPQQPAKSKKRSIARGFQARSVRKAEGAASFVSRLKSFTTNKNDHDGESDLEASEVYDFQEEQDQAQSGWVQNLRGSKVASQAYADDGYEDVQDDTDLDEETMSAEAVTEPEDAHAASQVVSRAAVPGSTAAISPIDVSQFMDKEDIDEDSFEEEDNALDPSLYYEDDLFDESLLEASSAQFASDPTRRVSAEEVQEAIEEARNKTSVLESHQEQHQEQAVPQPEQETEQRASSIVGMDAMIPQISSAAEIGNQVKRQVIVLPDVTVAHDGNESSKQRAPMAATNRDSRAGSKALLSNMLPKIEESSPRSAHQDEPAHDSFGLNIPSPLDTGSTPSTVSATGSFSTAGATGIFAPVGDELVADVDPQDLYVNDADDSVYDDGYTKTGAFAGRDYVEMPKSRAGRLFGRFRKKKDKEREDISVNEWVDVDDSYDARSVGKARGDWSSFRQDGGSDAYTSEPPSGDDGFVEIDYHQTDFYNRRDWNGGAFSLGRLKKNKKSDDPYEEDEPIEEDAVYQEELDVDVDPTSALRVESETDASEQINRELRRLQDFRHPDIDTEVWFVALGAEHYCHSGMMAFLEEHADELKGAFIINLEALGAGTLSAIEQEGGFKAYKASSRMKRFARQAGERSGITYQTATLRGRETAATCAMAHGVQAFTIAGMGDNGNTAFFSLEDDVVDNIDESKLKEASDFVLALLKSV